MRGIGEEEQREREGLVMWRRSDRKRRGEVVDGLECVRLDLKLNSEYEASGVVAAGLGGETREF